MPIEQQILPDTEAEAKYNSRYKGKHLTFDALEAKQRELEEFQRRAAFEREELERKLLLQQHELQEKFAQERRELEEKLRVVKTNEQQRSK